MRTIAQVSALIILVGMAGCEMMSPFDMRSGVLRFSLEMDDDNDNKYGAVMVYSTWLEFDRDLTIPIDNLFAQVNAGNTAVINEAQLYFKVGLDVLQQQHGMIFRPPTMSADRSERSLRLASTTSSWVYSTRWKSSSIPIMIADLKKPVNIRWRGNIPGAALSFNGVREKKVDIYAKLRIEVEHEVRPGTWQPATLQEASMTKLEQDLAHKITMAYRNYLQDRFGANTIRMDMRSSADRFQTTK